MRFSVKVVSTTVLLSTGVGLCLGSHRPLGDLDLLGRTQHDDVAPLPLVLHAAETLFADTSCMARPTLMNTPVSAPAG